jgi:DNA topoisomerase-1
VEEDFKPEFVLIKGKKKVLTELKALAKEADSIFLACDPDREGEAIAWHLSQELARSCPRSHRILLHEITKHAVLEALANPGQVNMSLVESQMARRILDRLVGYRISPLLWRRVKQGLSAGRVQSVALRLLVEREREIRAFVPEEFWEIGGEFRTAKGEAFSARLAKIKGKKASLRNGEQARAVVAALKDASFTVESVESKDVQRRPQAPYITSRLQQDGWRFFRFPAKKTMSLAQRLYEGIELGAQGAVGLITYMRTDSVRVNPDAISAVRGFISTTFGERYLPAEPHQYKNNKSAQDAHEAIRPASLDFPPEVVKAYLDADEFKLYSIIWKRFVASQMADAIFKQTTLDVGEGTHTFRATGAVPVFDGCLRVYKREEDEAEEAYTLPAVQQGEVVTPSAIKPDQRFTEPKPRFTESTLIRELEERGIGRPSTYATIVSTLLEKKYVERKEGKFVPAELGMYTCDALVSSFAQVLDVGFTARMEEQLDEVEEGQVEWHGLLRSFNDDFEKTLEAAEGSMKNLKQAAEETRIACDECGKPMLVKIGKNGPFLACSGYPECRNTREYTRDAKGAIQLVEKKQAEGNCPKCGSPLVRKRGRFGEFEACSKYPECKFTRSVASGVNCPVDGCTGMLIQRRSMKGRMFYGCSRYPECKFTAAGEPVKQACEACGFPLMVKQKKRDEVVLMCASSACGHRAAAAE